MSYLKDNFDRELEILKNKYGENNLVIKKYINEIENIINIFSNEGHSGASAPPYAFEISRIIKNALLAKPFTELTGEDEEYYEYNELDDNDNVVQNKRDPRIFKNKKYNYHYFIDAIKFREYYDDDIIFTGTVEDVSSSMIIKNFPFTPQCFIIDVILDENKDDYIIMDRNQLQEVFNYYIPFAGDMKIDYEKYLRKRKIDKIKNNKK